MPKAETFTFTDTVNEESGIVIFELNGEIKGGGETTMFHGRVHEHIRTGRKMFVLNMKEITWMNSIGLGMLISANTTIANASGRLALAHIDQVESIFDITRLKSVFNIYENCEVAIRSFTD